MYAASALLSLFCDNIHALGRESLNDPVDAEIGALPSDMPARLSRLRSVIEQVGFGGLPRD